MIRPFSARFEEQLAEDALELAVSLWPESAVRVGADDARVTLGAGVLDRAKGATRGDRLRALLGQLATFDTVDTEDPDGP